MDPGTILNVLGLGAQILDLIIWACNKRWAHSSKDLQAELELFRTQLDENLQYVKGILEQADDVGFKPKSLEILQNELQKFVSSAKDLFNKGYKKEDIRKLRELVMDTLQYRMVCTLFEMGINNYQMQSKVYEELKAIKEMIAKNVEQEMMSKKHDALITIFEEQAHNNPKLKWALSFVRNLPYSSETFWECFNSVLGDEHPNLVVPIEASEDKADAGMVIEVEESGSVIKEVAAKNVPEEEEDEKNNKKRKEGFFMKEGAGKEVLEEEKNKKRKGALLKDMEWQDDEEQDNLNGNMELTVEEGKGELIVSQYKESQLKVITYKWCDKSMRMVIGKKPMEVSNNLGYFYFEVTLVEMAELLQGSETRLAGVGVGLARLDKFRTSKMAGKYSKSCGYDGRVGEVYCESRVQGSSKMGFLAMGDTLGIGLLQHRGQHPIFFVKNGVLQVCIQDHSLCAPSRHGGLHPVISVASANVQLHVNFHGPFELSELVMQVKAALAHK